MKIALEANEPISSRTRRTSRAARKPLLLLATFTLLVVGVYFLWDHVRDRVTVDPDNLMDVGQINLTPPPSWIHTDIKAQVIREAGWGPNLSLLDDRLTVNVAQAFALHPWIAKVQRVSKSKSTGVTVEVDYRQPVAMIEVAGGLLAIDADAIVLPSDDFTAKDAHEYPRITGIQTAPRGPVGTRWGDAGVAAGARLALYLREHWRSLQLKKIVSLTDPSVAPADRPEFSLITSGDRVLTWGHLPGQELPGEFAAGEKIARLKRHFAENGSLDEGEPLPAQRWPALRSASVPR